MKVEIVSKSVVHPVIRRIWLKRKLKELGAKEISCGTGVPAVDTITLNHGISPEKATKKLKEIFRPQPEVEYELIVRFPDSPQYNFTHNQVNDG